MLLLSSESRTGSIAQGSGPGRGWPEGINKCMYCWQNDHYLKRHCQLFQGDLNSNRICLGDESRVCLGVIYGLSVANAEKLRI